MKKRLFSMLCMVGTVAIVSAQAVDLVIPAQETCTSVPVSHWSLGIKAGVSDFLIPPDVPTYNDRYNIMYGGIIDYTFNPFIGIGLEYDYNDYSRPYTYRNFEGKLDGLTNDFILYGSVNLSNALAPFRAGFWKCLNIYGDLGAGVGFYQYALDNAKNKYQEAMMGKIGLNAEFTLSKSVNLSIAGQYNQYDSRNMSDARANRNCDALIGTIGLKFKIGSGSKLHARNINLCEYSPKPIPTIVKNVYVKGETEGTLSHLKAVTDENADLKLKLQKMEEDAKYAALQKKMATTELTLQEKLKKMEEDLKTLSTQKEGVVNLSLENIQFKTGSSVLTASTYTILDQVASILTSNSAWTTLKVSGHTDNVGSEALNLKLSKSRALSVKKYLVSKGVPTSKIFSTGWGEGDPIAPNDTPEGRQKNRRVEFEIK